MLVIKRASYMRNCCVSGIMQVMKYASRWAYFHSTVCCRYL